jgi:hypothetical protein
MSVSVVGPLRAGKPLFSVLVNGLHFDRVVARGGLEMRKVPGSLVAVVALVAFVVPSLRGTDGAAAVPVRHLAATGGTVTWPVAVHDAKTCAWSSSPALAGFATTVKCASGRLVRSFRVGANPSTKARDYLLSLTARGETTTVSHLEIVEAGQPQASTTTDPTTTTSTTSTTTTTTTIPLTVGSPGYTSPNWSGYVLTGATGGYEAIGGGWTVPTLNCQSVPNGYTTDWVGVNGFGDENPGLFQDGTTSYCQNGVQGDNGWWTDASWLYASQILFTVSPGDAIYAQVYKDSTGYWNYSIEDVTTGVSSTSPESFAGPGTCAEWIAEDPGIPNTSSTNSLYPLADFGSVTFTNLGLTVPSGSWTVPPYSDAVEMVGTNGAIEASPSPVYGAAAAADFTVTYRSPGDVESPAKTAAATHPQSTFATLTPRPVVGHQTHSLARPLREPD